jgi:hypothetical protein
MSLLSRSAGLLALMLGLGAAAAAAQETDHGGTFKWYIGGQAGLLNFVTPAQSRSSIFTTGGNVLITAHRAGLLLEMDEGFGSKEASTFADPTAGGVARAVTFNHIRKYSAMLTAHPVSPAAPIQPYLGLGFGLMHVVNPQLPGSTFATEDQRQAALDAANDAGSTGFGAALLGLQFKLDRFALFGQGQITTSAARTKLIVNPTVTLTGGLRISLGNAREGLSGGGY